MIYVVSHLLFRFPESTDQKIMKRKLFACGLSLTLLLAQNLFVYSQTTNAPVRSTDELVALLDEPEAVVVVNVRKMLAETAPTLLNNDAATVEKLRATMQSIENETGVNPFSIDKIAVGVKLDKTADSPLVVLQTVDSAAALAENIAQNQIAKARLDDEINPLKNRISFDEQAMAAIKDNVIPPNQPSAAEVKFLEEFQAKLAKLKPSKTEQAVYNRLKADSDKLLELLKNYQTLLPAVYDLGDLPERLTAVKTAANKISAGDAQRTAKIAAAGKNLTAIEAEFASRRNRMLGTDEARTFGVFLSDNFSGVPDDYATASAATRKNALAAMQKSVGKRVENLDSVIAEMKSAAPKPSDRTEESDAEIRKNAPNALSTTVTRKAETVGGKKLFVLTTIRKYGENSLSESTPNENAMLVFDDKTLLMGDRAAIVKSIENKSANRSQIARALIAKTPDALVSFGVDLRNVDLNEFAKAFGEQKTAWQIFGALTGADNDLSLSATVEKTDFPVKFTPKTGAAETSKPLAANDDAVNDLIGLLTKSITGIESRITVRFEKKKALAMLDQSPQFLGAILNGKRRSMAVK